MVAVPGGTSFGLGVVSPAEAAPVVVLIPDGVPDAVGITPTEDLVCIPGGGVVAVPGGTSLATPVVVPSPDGVPEAANVTLAGGIVCVPGGKELLVAVAALPMPR